MTTKSTAEHTPGKWHLWNKNGVIEVQDSKGVAVVFWTGFDACDRPKREKLANAAFIAAAPETAAERDRLREENASLIETLERVTSEVSWFIKRKKNLAEIVVGDIGVKVWADVLDEDLDIARAALARHAKAEGRS